uniref:Putative homing endonuclease n=1 Tax=viral metagenome TaxID=1070528 RepID=A0A6M3L827_9ZZZZ
MKRLLITLSDNLYDDLKTKAIETNNSMTEIVREYLRTCDGAVKIQTREHLIIRRWSTVEWSLKVRERDKCVCQKCGRQGDDHTMIAHHILSRKQGGKNVIENGITLCKPCHGNIHKKTK